MFSSKVIGDSLSSAAASVKGALCFFEWKNGIMEVDVVVSNVRQWAFPVASCSN